MSKIYLSKEIYLHFYILSSKKYISIRDISCSESWFIPPRYIFSAKRYIFSAFFEIYFKNFVDFEFFWDISHKRYIFLEIFSKKIYPQHISPEVTNFFQLYLSTKKIYFSTKKIYLKHKKIYLLWSKIYPQLHFHERLLWVSWKIVLRCMWITSEDNLVKGLPSV